MKVERQQDGVSEYWLERYRLNELPPAEAVRLRDRLRDDADLRRRLESLERSEQELRDAGLLDRLAARVRQRVDAQRAAPEPKATQPRLRWLAPAGVAVAVIVAAVTIPRLATVKPQDAADAGGTAGTAGEDTIKGLRPALAIYRQTSRGSETLADGDLARAGDVIRVGYRAAGHGYGVILSIDGRGVVTLHLPPDGARAAALESGASVLLDRAYELDDAPRWERFYFIAAAKPFDVTPIVDAARRAATRDGVPVATLPLPRDFEQSTFSLQKESR